MLGMDLAVGFWRQTHHDLEAKRPARSTNNMSISTRVPPHETRTGLTDRVS